MGTAVLNGCHGLGVLDDDVRIADAKGDGDKNEQGFRLAFVDVQVVSRVVCERGCGIDEAVCPAE